jgi:hypothetical protein
MERSVKTNLIQPPTFFLFNGGVRFKSSSAAGLVRVQRSGAARLARVQQAGAAIPMRFTVTHASAIGVEAIRQYG